MISVMIFPWGTASFEKAYLLTLLENCSMVMFPRLTFASHFNLVGHRLESRVVNLVNSKFCELSQDW
jgi:hypothetical protein